MMDINHNFVCAYRSRNLILSFMVLTHRETADQLLGAGSRGQVIYPGDALFDPARKVFNGLIDRRPLAVIRCAGVQDAVRCIEFARRHDLPLTIRGGAHSVAGNAVRDNALMLDLSGMKGIQVDPDTKTVRAEPGLTLGEFDRATQGFGLATTLGVVSTTGIAGLTLGGGLG
jgi:FAD/FMN-containing dehydrogenase